PYTTLFRSVGYRLRHPDMKADLRGALVNHFNGNMLFTQRFQRGDNGIGIAFQPNAHRGENRQVVHHVHKIRLQFGLDTPAQVVDGPGQVCLIDDHGNIVLVGGTVVGLDTEFLHDTEQAGGKTDLLAELILFNIDVGDIVQLGDADDAF